jgi:uncharacterized HAD superfamily protein
VDGAIAVLQRFEAMKDLDWRFITSRPDWARQSTRAWLDRHGLSHRELLLTTRGKPLAVQMGLDAFIDDDIMTVRQLSAQGLHVFFMDNPWNQDEELPANCCRVCSWEDFDRELRQLSSSGTFSPTSR